MGTSNSKLFERQWRGHGLGFSYWILVLVPTTKQAIWCWLCRPLWIDQLLKVRLRGRCCGDRESHRWEGDRLDKSVTGETQRWKAKHFLFFETHVRLTLWADTFYWKGRSAPIQKASCLVLGSAKVSGSWITKTFSLWIPWRLENQGTCPREEAGWPWRECYCLSGSRWWPDRFLWDPWWLWSCHHRLKLS